MSFFEKHTQELLSFARHLPEKEENEHPRKLAEYIEYICESVEDYDLSTDMTIRDYSHSLYSGLTREITPDSYHNIAFIFGLVANERFLRGKLSDKPTEGYFLKYYNETNKQLSEDVRYDLNQRLKIMQIRLSSDYLHQGFTYYENAHGIAEKIKEDIATGLQRTIQNSEGAANKLKAQIDGWKEYLDAHQDQLNDVKSTYNFVGLSKGFDNIETSKRNGRGWLLFFLILMGVITIVVPCLAIWINLEFAPKIKWTGSLDDALKIAPLILPIEVICIYYFRIMLKNYMSMSAQIVQLELRQALCSFIQNYVEFKQKLDGDVSIDKFEEMIFSGITMEPGQIPQTFDGLEKLAGALNALKPKAAS